MSHSMGAKNFRKIFFQNLHSPIENSLHENGTNEFLGFFRLKRVQTRHISDHF